ncbi:hypothetical protein H310_04631 [Aphanomyces invadans]|uniref:Uncharacterized protein n=1 Tax=Aphanomyces invadans TaxID=157072 RepID=A0A024UDP4_9STRA|nr:hypothetical protein H310_04631 [Aphanomyces invadans]ETW04330.1 hypothetical protein H310_04631 [Aphanomyces invadans]|eukprot:XP_008867286.1 hypothetical protein H310_04631 [Aphanomyces invadans]
MTSALTEIWLWRCLVLAALLLSDEVVAAVSSLTTAPPPSSECRVVVEAGPASIVFFVVTPSEGDMNDFVVSSPLPMISRGLHTLAPEDAYSHLKEALHELSARHMDERLRPECPLYIIGTSGMRELSEARQSDIYDAIFASYAADASVNSLPPLERSHLRTLSEDEQNYFLMVAANFLDKRVGKDMQPTSVQVYGVLDLDPSSFRISMDIEQRWRHSARKKSYRLSPLQQSEFFVHTFANTGTSAIHDQVQHAVEATNRTHNPCLFAGSPAPFVSQTSEGSPTVVAGDGPACMALIESIVATGNENCTKGEHCVLLSYEQPHATGTFYAVHDWFQMASLANTVVAATHPSLQLDLPTPSRYELEKAANAVCGLSFQVVSTALLDPTKHDEASSAAAKASAPWTCLNLCYIAVLLKQLGLTDAERRILYVQSIHDRPVHWVFGAHLKMESDRRVVYEAALGEYLSMQVERGLPVGYNLSLLVLAFALLTLYLLVHRASGRDGTHALLFVHDTTQ